MKNYKNEIIEIMGKNEIDDLENEQLTEILNTLIRQWKNDSMLFRDEYNIYLDDRIDFLMNEFSYNTNDELVIYFDEIDEYFSEMDLYDIINNIVKCKENVFQEILFYNSLGHFYFYEPYEFIENEIYEFYEINDTDYMIELLHEII